MGSKNHNSIDKGNCILIHDNFGVSNSKYSSEHPSLAHHEFIICQNKHFVPQILTLFFQELKIKVWYMNPKALPLCNIFWLDLTFKHYPELLILKLNTMRNHYLTDREKSLDAKHKTSKA